MDLNMWLYTIFRDNVVFDSIGEAVDMVNAFIGDWDIILGIGGFTLTVGMLIFVLFGVPENTDGPGSSNPNDRGG